MLSEIKFDLKCRAIKIRRKRKEMKEAQRQGKPFEYLGGLSQEYRYRHVAYCLVRGRKREEIENKVRPGNELDEDLLKMYVEALEHHLHILRGTLPKSQPDPDKLYVVVDDTLPKVYAGVQASHALAEYLRQNPKTAWQNGTLVVLKADMCEVHRFKQWGWTGFHEPDLGGRLTAVANFRPKQLLSHLSLL